MNEAGDIVLVRFPDVDMSEGKLRPVLVLKGIPGPYNDWLVCMVSSKLHQYVASSDDIIRETDSDFSQSGLKTPSVFRSGRLATLEGQMLLGVIGSIGGDRLRSINKQISDWLNDYD